MFLIIGLGNPGTEYEQTRHNAGFMALDFIAKEHCLPGKTLDKKHESVVLECQVAGNKLLLAWPQTFMNNSGNAVRSISSFYKIAPDHIIIIHDDIDLPLGTVKPSFSSGSAGHKGVESTIEKLGTKDFHRIRIGILPKEGKPEHTEDFVLQKFSEEEIQLLRDTFVQASAVLNTILESNKKEADDASQFLLYNR